MPLYRGIVGMLSTQSPWYARLYIREEINAQIVRMHAVEYSPPANAQGVFGVSLLSFSFNSDKTQLTLRGEFGWWIGGGQYILVEHQTAVPPWNGRFGLDPNLLDFKQEATIDDQLFISRQSGGGNADRSGIDDYDWTTGPGGGGGSPGGGQGGDGLRVTQFYIELVRVDPELFVPRARVWRRKYNAIVSKIK